MVTQRHGTQGTLQHTDIMARCDHFKATAEEKLSTVPRLIYSVTSWTTRAVHCGETSQKYPVNYNPRSSLVGGQNPRLILECSGVTVPGAVRQMEGSYAAYSTTTTRHGVKAAWLTVAVLCPYPMSLPKDIIESLSLPVWGESSQSYPAADPSLWALRCTGEAS